jgi:hypothetical protein
MTTGRINQVATLGSIARGKTTRVASHNEWFRTACVTRTQRRPRECSTRKLFFVRLFLNKMHAGKQPSPTQPNHAGLAASSRPFPSQDLPTAKSTARARRSPPAFTRRERGGHSYKTRFDNTRSCATDQHCPRR